MHPEQQRYEPPHPWVHPEQAPWPFGPGRPAVATTAIVLGFVTGGLTAVLSLVSLFLLIAGAQDLVTVLLLLLGAWCAGALIISAAWLAGRRSPKPLYVSALVAVGSLLLLLLAGSMAEGSVLGVAVFVVLALPLPVLTAAFARLPRVAGWVDDADDHLVFPKD
jgi:hypothetical protein